jgi:hypothetical protein
MADVQVTDRIGWWRGLDDWSAHEREAILLGVRAAIVGLVASRDMTILEIDFANPEWASDRCPPRRTFVHRLTVGRSQRLDIHYACPWCDPQLRHERRDDAPLDRPRRPSYRHRRAGESNGPLINVSTTPAACTGLGRAASPRRGREQGRRPHRDCQQASD